VSPATRGPRQGVTDTHPAQGKGPPLAGGRALQTPFGTFYSPNITADKEHGIGAWSADDLWRALTQGEGPGGVHYYPVFPFPSYTAMKRSDSDDLYHYLMSAKPQALANWEHDLSWFVTWRFTNWVWKLLFYDPQTFMDNSAKSKAWNRGAYLVKVLGHCGECHSPRAANGVVQRALHLSGNPQGPEGEPVPSLRDDVDDGIKHWSASDITTYLRSGEDPNFDFSCGAMVEVIDDSTSKLSDEDLDAIAMYLQDFPPL
jgi:mono/diheme cytochrome c family protein